MSFTSTTKSGKRECVSPHRLSLLVLIKGLCTAGCENKDELLNCIRRCRYGVSLLILRLIQAEDVELRDLREMLDSVDHDKELADLLLQGLQGLLKGGVAGVTDLILSLDDLLSGQEPALHKTSLFGLFTRRMNLSFHKMSFSQVAHFLTQLQSYVQPVDLDEDQADPVDVSMDLSGFGDTKEQDAAGWVRDTPMPNKRPEYFLAKQAAALQSNECSALSAPELQSRIADILSSTPDITEAHYVSYLNCLRQGEFKEGLESLYRYFDGQQWPWPTSGTESEDLNKEEYCRFRYAALNLAMIHCRFGHRQEAFSALKEAIEIAQATNDHVCLVHCLGLLYRLEQEGCPQAKALLDRFVARAAELKISYLTSLGMLSHAKHDAMTGLPPPNVLQTMATVYAINSQNSLNDLLGITLSQHASLWQLYGKSHVALVFNQLELQLSGSSASSPAASSLSASSPAASPLSAPPNEKLGPKSAEASCLSLCNLAQEHADRGMFVEAAEILSFCKKTFVKHSSLSKIWIRTEAIIDHDKATCRGNIDLANQAVRRLAAVDSSGAKYRSAVNLMHQGQFTECFSLLHALLDQTREKTILNDGQSSVVEHQANILLCLSKLYLVLDDPLSALPHLLHCLTLSCRLHMEGCAAVALLYLAQVQLSLGLPTMALSLVRRSMIQILSHGSLYLQNCAQFLLVKCQLALAETPKVDRKAALLSVSQTLDKVLNNFRKLEAMNKIRDVLYYQAQIYHELGYFSKRNQCAAECRRILQQQNIDAAPSAICIL